MRTERSEGLDGLSEADLVRGAGRGDAACFQRIMRLHNRLLFRTARAILRDDAEAEEAVQDAYVRAFRTLDGFRGEARLGTWLARIVSNEALARLRKATRRSSIVAIFPGYDEEAVGMEDGMESRPEKRVHQAELARLIERQVDALPELYRAVFVLRAVEDLSVEETAAVLGIPEPTVRTRFRRARAQLRAALESKIDVACDGVFGFDGDRCDRLVENVLARLNFEEKP